MARRSSLQAGKRLQPFNSFPVASTIEFDVRLDVIGVLSILSQLHPCDLRSKV
ncbi:MAG: hypothetical protein N3E41_08885 [Thermofilaceae archaeon]|nr:hypothetical protein [Thermofilaceae archaeon]